jgi:hypothetical protein
MAGSLSSAGAKNAHRQVRGDRESANSRLTKSADERPLGIESQLNAFAGLVSGGLPGPLT